MIPGFPTLENNIIFRKMEVNVGCRSTVGGADRGDCPDLSYRDRADVAVVKSWSGFAGNRAAEMQDIALVFMFLWTPGRVDST